MMTTKGKRQSFEETNSTERQHKTLCFQQDKQHEVESGETEVTKHNLRGKKKQSSHISPKSQTNAIEKTRKSWIIWEKTRG